MQRKPVTVLRFICESGVVVLPRAVAGQLHGRELHHQL